MARGESMTDKKNVGYIGLGNIGKPAAEHLICEAFKVHVFDVYQPAVDELAEKGAIGCASVAELAARCEYIGICVRDDAQVDELLYGDEGILANAVADTIIAIHSTVSRAAVIRWADDARAKQCWLIDAAITGAATGAKAGTLCYMVGGPVDIIERARPMMETSAKSIVHAGELGCGALLKQCNNLITYAEFMAMSEATRLAEAGGLSSELLREVGKSNGVVNESMFAFVKNRAVVFATMTPEERDQRFGSFGKLAEKDLDCALQSAAEMNLDLPSTAQLRDVVYKMFMSV
jgi:3-hydroxyisobutyrate dehydrogenase